MKKVLLTAMVVLTVASASVFGMYGKGDSWIDFLAHGNQFRARMDQLGFVLGNGTIKGTLGVRADQGYLSKILAATNNSSVNDTFLRATLSAGIGYTSEMIGVGVGYNFTYIDKNLQVHTPVLMINALNNNLRISAPIQVAVTDKLNGADGVKYTGIGFNNIQLRYYTGIDAFNAIRLYAYYRNSSYDDGVDKGVSEALGFQARFYFLNTQVGDVGVNPYIRLEYYTALKGDDFETFTAEGYDASTFSVPTDAKQSDVYEVSPYKFAIKPVLALYANSDVVSLWFEPSLGYTLVGAKEKDVKQEMTHALTWGAYAELYVTPVKDLEWYFEMDVNGNVTGQDTAKANENLAPVYFETTTGITWYLPSLQ